MDGQIERIIQSLEDLLRACILEQGGSCLPLIEFTYNNSWHSISEWHLWKLCTEEGLERVQWKSSVGTKDDSTDYRESQDDLGEDESVAK
jgi:hypothetical protein